MLEMMLTRKKVQPATFLHIDFEDQEVGSTQIIDKLGNYTFELVGANAGSVIDDPTMGKCFQFNGAGGYRTIAGNTPIWKDENLNIKVDCQPGNTASRIVLMTGETASPRVQGFALYINSTNGYYGSVNSATNSANARGGSKNVARVTIDFIVGGQKGTVLKINGTTLAPNGIGLTLKYDADNPLYIGQMTPGLTNAPPFVGKIKSIIITRAV